jgi:signal transduction histidine kinase
MINYKWNNKILIVEDEIEIAKGYKEILSPYPSKSITSSRNLKIDDSKHKIEFEVHIAEDFDEALNLVKRSIELKQPFTLGFFDVLLGGVRDGIDLVKEVFVLDPDIYAVFVTAYHDRSVDSIRSILKEKSIERWDYLNKPLNDGELLQKARNYNALWNLKKEKKVKDIELNILRRRIYESDKTSSIAAISRSVTHEFGNVLMQIMGKADLGRHKNQEEMKKTLEIILEASQRASQILERFKNANPGNLPKEKSTVYVHELLEKCLELMEFQIDTSQTKIIKKKIEPIKLNLNTTSILQVFLNLILNSIQALGKGGQISFEIFKAQDEAKIIITDNGPGVPNDIFDQIQLPFFTTKGNEGSGLGLAICKEIIEVEHSGQFEIKNLSPNGFEVSLILPITNDLILK